MRGATRTAVQNLNIVYINAIFASLINLNTSVQHMHVYQKVTEGVIVVDY